MDHPLLIHTFLPCRAGAPSPAEFAVEWVPTNDYYGGSLTAGDGTPALHTTKMKGKSKPKYPKRKRPRLPLGAYQTSGTWFFVTICCREKKALFRSARRRDLVERALVETAERQHVELASYVVMPDHVHFICSAGVKGLIGFVRDFKVRTTTVFRQTFKIGSPWQARFFDHKIRSDESLDQKCQYVRMNPVRKGLVSKPEDYSWTGLLLTG